MALQLRRGETRSFGKVVAASFVVMAFAVQGILSHNAPSVFALSGGTVSITNTAELQSALANQADGQTWKLAAGTYDQATLHITNAITITGPSNGSAIIKVPSTMTNGGKLVDIASTGVVLNHVTLAGTVPAAGCNDGGFGIYFENGASATINNSSIIDMRDANTGLQGCQQGIAVRIGSQAAGIAATATLNNVTINGYQKAGIVVDGVGSSATIKNSTVTGAGPVGYIAQNGIQVSRGATASIKGNTVTDNSYTGADFAVGLLLYGAGDHTVVSGNTVSGNQLGYYTQTQANLKYLDVTGISGNTRDAVAFTGADFGPAWIQPSSTWADAAISGAMNADGGDIVSTGGGLHVYGYDAFTTIPSAVQAVSTNGTVSLGSDQTTTAQVTLAKKLTLNGNGHVLAPNFVKTDNGNNSALGIQASGVIVKNLVEDGAQGTNLHGINVYSATGVSLSDVTVKNNDYSGLNVDGSKVTVTNLSTMHNGWDGVDVDKAGAVLTVKGVSHHDETTPSIYIDKTSVGKVVDTNNQYDFVNNFKQTGDRAYGLKLSAPTTPYPGNAALINTNNFWFTWSAIPGAVSYEWQGSQSNALDSNGNLANVSWTGDYQRNQPTGPTAHSVGASGTWYWQVRAVGASGTKSPWSAVWGVTIDTTAPAAPSSLVWTGSNNQGAQNGYTNIQKGTLSWKDTTPGDVDHYVYKFWTNIPGYQDNASNPWHDSYTYVVKTSDGGYVPTDFADKEGTYYFCVEAVDAAGNTSACTQSVVTYDKTAPVIDGVSVDRAVTNLGSLTVSGTVTDANLKDYNLRVYNADHSAQVNANPWTGLTGTGNVSNGTLGSLNISGLADGNYWVRIWADDLAGNRTGISSQIFIPFTIDRTAPNVHITSFARNSDGTYTVTGTTDDSSDVAITIDSQAPFAVTPTGGVWSVKTAVLVDGKHTVSATSTDAVGNESTPVEESRTTSSGNTTVEKFAGVIAAALPVQFAATVPFTTGAPNAANNDQSVLGDQTTTPSDGKTSSGRDGKDDEAVKGASTTRAQDSTPSFIGLAWYWWLAVLAAVAGLWWLLVARRRKSAE